MKKVTLYILFILFALSFTQQSKAQSFSVQSYTIIPTHEVVLYPNPVTEDFFRVKSNDIINQVEVINVIGQSIHKKKNEDQTPEALLIQLNNCEKGMYCEYPSDTDIRIMTVSINIIFFNFIYFNIYFNT